MTLFLNSKSQNSDSFTCKFYIFNTNILHFLLILPNIFRSLRLVDIFDIKLYKIHDMRHKLKEYYYLKVFLFNIVIGNYHVFHDINLYFYIFN